MGGTVERHKENDTVDLFPPLGMRIQAFIHHVDPILSRQDLDASSSYQISRIFYNLGRIVAVLLWLSLTINREMKL